MKGTVGRPRTTDRESVTLRIDRDIITSLRQSKMNISEAVNLAIRFYFFKKAEYEKLKSEFERRPILYCEKCKIRFAAIESQCPKCNGKRVLLLAPDT